MDNQNNKNKGPNNNRQGWGIILFTTLLITFIVMGLFSLMRGGTPEEISYDKFLKLVDNKKVESVTFTNSRINIVLTDSARKEKLKGTLKEVKDESKKSSSSKESTEKSGTSDSSKDSSSSAGENETYDLISQLQEQMQDSGDTEEKDPDYYTGLVNDETLVEKLKKGGVQFKAEVPDTAGSLITELVITVVPIILMVLLFAFFMKRMTKGGGMMGIGKSNAKMYMEKQTGVTFQNVAGQDEAKESLQEVVDFLHNPEKYSGIGAKLPKGALLVGPPGTGKTLLAKAVAGEAGVPFFSLSGSAFVEMYVGVGASRVRDLFKQAQQMAPCIVFIDEIDAIGKTRDTAMGGNDEREQTLNQLLAEMDGFDTNKGLLVLAATNRPEVLDPALLRPGRFDRRIIVDKPDLKGRVDVLKVHAKDVKMDESVNLEEIALATSGAVGSDLANMINEAAINAVKNGRQVVSQKDLFEAVEVVLVGKEKKDRIMSAEERRIVSYHEVGHALVTALQKNTEPVQKITIVPRTMGALGYVMQTPEEEKFLNTKKELEAMIVVALGGRAAEEIVFDTVTTGASNDIEQATKIARAMITQYGMSDRFGLMGLESIQNRYLDGRPVLNCGEATASQIDEEVMRMLKSSYEEAKRLLSENRDALDRIAAFLIEKETITGKEFMKIYRKVQGIEEPEGDRFDLLVLDVDGTLHNSHREISDATKNALIEAQKRGKTIAIASGRSIAGIRQTASAISLEEYGGYVIAYNGTTVINCKTGECIYNQTLPADLIAPVYEEAAKLQVAIMAYRDSAKEIIVAGGVTDYVAADAAASCVTIRETEQFVKELSFPINKIFVSGEPDKMKEVERILQRKFGSVLNVFRSDPYYVELLPKYTDKGVAVDKLVKYMDITKERVMCVGDSNNDLPMLRYAGMGVAMGNASDRIKEQADYVTDSNDDDGIVKVIEKFMTEAHHEEG